MTEFTLPVTETSERHGHVCVEANDLREAIDKAERLLELTGNTAVEFTSGHMGRGVDDQAYKAAGVNRERDMEDDQEEGASHPVERLVETLKELGINARVIDEDAERAAEEQVNEQVEQGVTGASEADVRQAIADKMEDASDPLFNAVVEVNDELQGTMTIPFRAHDISEAVLFAETWRDAHVPGGTIVGVEKAEDAPDVAKAA